MGKTKELLLVHPAMQRVTLNESVNVMLTPQFYTLKKETLPVKYAYQAKRIAPSLFDGLLEDASEYEYMVFKKNDGWVFIAYNIAKVIRFLASKGIERGMVSKLFFAEQALDAFSSPLALGEKEALVVLDDSVVVVPSIALGEEEQPSLVFDTQFTPDKGVSLQGEMGSFLSQKQAYAFATVFLLFAGLFVAEGLRYGDEKGGEEELQALYTSYPALESSYTRDGVISKYRKIDQEERKKRETIKNLSNMIFKGVTLTTLHIDEQKFRVEFTCVSKKVSKKLQELVKKANYSAKAVKNSFNLDVEGSL